MAFHEYSVGQAPFVLEPKDGGVISTHLCQSNSCPLRPRHRVTWIKTKREGVYVKSGRSGAPKPGKFSLA